VGGGAFPTHDLPTRLVSVAARDLTVTELEQRLRTGAISVVARIAEDRLLLDPRTLLDGDEEPMLEAFRRIATPPSA
jgi:L-seryl-tRNA(Ser) seleniumtransferase